MVGLIFVAKKYSASINGLTGIALTKLDILDNFETIYVCTHYEYKEGKKISEMSKVLNFLDDVKPVYKSFKDGIVPLKSVIVLKNYLQKQKNILNIYHQKLISQ